MVHSAVVCICRVAVGSRCFLVFFLPRNPKKAKKFVEEIDDPFWDNLSPKYGWHRLNKACLEINGIMKRYERLPMISLNNLEYKDLKKKINIIKKRLIKWKK